MTEPRQTKVLAGTYFRVTGKDSLGLTPKGRKVRIPFDQIVWLSPPNLFHNIFLQQIQGPMKGLTIKLKIAYLRKVKHVKTCPGCKTYSFPHRWTQSCPELKKTQS